MRKILMGAVGMLALAAGSGTGFAVPYNTGPAPDFIITNVTLVGSTNIVNGKKQIAEILVDVVENCHRGKTYMPYVTVDVYASKGGQALTSLGNELFIPATGVAQLQLKSGVTPLALPIGAYVYAQVDSASKIPEVNEANNYRSVNPIQGPFPPSAGYCDVADSNAGRPH